MTSHPLEFSPSKRFKSIRCLTVSLLSCSRSKCGSRTVASSGGSSTWRPNRCAWSRGDSSTEHRRPVTTNNPNLIPIKFGTKFDFVLVSVCSCFPKILRLPKFYRRKKNLRVYQTPPQTRFIDSFDVNNSKISIKSLYNIPHDLYFHYLT
jgi:hypothetical protein